MLNVEQTVEIINHTLNLNLDPASIAVNATFKSLGIDSLDFYNVLVELETVTDRKVPDEDVEKITTINDIIAYFS